MSQSLDHIIDQFSDHLQFEKRYSTHTLQAYRTDLVAFRDYLSSTADLSDLAGISPALVRSWLASLKEEGIGARSIKRKLSALKSFFKFALRMGKIEKSPAAGLISPKAPVRLPVFLPEKDVHELFERVVFPDNWAGLTARLAMSMLYQLGVRVSELTGCREDQVDFGNRQIKVLGKGGKERIIPAGSQLLTDIGVYLGRKKELGQNVDRTYLLVTEKGRKLYPRYVQQLTARYLAEVTTVQKKSPHVFRHSFATHLSNNGAPLNDIKELLGHSSLAATQVYTHNTIEKLKKVHQRAHPKG